MSTDPKKTHLAKPEEIEAQHEAGQDEAASAPATPAKPPLRVPVIPNMSLDDDEPIVVEAEPEPPVAQAAPIPFAHAAPEEVPLAQPVPPGSAPDSQVYEAYAVDDEAVLGEEAAEAVPVEPVNKAESDVYLADAVEDVPAAQLPVSPSDVIEVESASEVMDIEDEVLVDEYVPAQPMDSPVWKATPPISGIAQEGETVEELHTEDDVFAIEDEAPAGSSVVHVQPATGDLLEASAASKRSPRSEEPADQEAADFEEAIPFADDENDEAQAPDDVVEAADSAVVAEEVVAEGEPTEAPSEIALHELFNEAADDSAARSAVKEAEQTFEEPIHEEAILEPEEHIFEPAAEEVAEAAETPSGSAPSSWSSIGEVFNDEPVAQAPASDVYEDGLAEVEEEIAEAAPASEVRAADSALPEEVEQVASPSDIAADMLFEEAKEEAMPSSDIAAEVLADEAAPVGPSPSDIAADALFEEAAAEAAPESEVAEAEEFEAEEFAEAAPASGVQAEEVVFDEDVAEITPASAVQVDEHVLEEEIPPAAVAPSDVAAEALFDEATDEAAPASEVAEAEEFEEEYVAEAAPASAVQADEAIFDEEVAEVAPGSAIQVEENAFEEEDAPVAASPSDIAADALFEEATAEPASGSAVVAGDDLLDDELAEAMPASGVLADEVIFDEDVAAPASDVHAAEPSDVAAEALFEEAGAEEAAEAEIFEEEIAEAAPASEVVAADEPAEDVIEEDVIEIAPESAVLDAEEANDEESTEAASALEVQDEDLAEAVEAEEVLDDDLAEAEPVSAVAEEDLFAEEEIHPASVVAEAGAPAQEEDSATVLFDELVHDAGPKSKKKKKGSSARKKKEIDQTIAFESPSSSTEKAALPDFFVTDDEEAETSEGSAVNLGEMPAHKGSSISGIDPVAEALESGIGLGAGEKDQDAPSVEFDEILDEFGPSSGELDLEITRGKRPAKKKDETEGSTEMEAGSFLDEDFAVEKPASSAKAKKDKTDAIKKPPIAQTGDEVDLSDMFDEPESVEEAEAEEVAEAAEEDAVSFDDDESAEAVEEADAEEAEAEEAEEAVSFDEEEIAAEEAEEAVSFDEEEAAEAEDAEDAEAAEAEDEISFDEDGIAEAAEDAEDAEAAEAFDEEEEAEAAEALDQDDMDLLDEDEASRKTAKAKAKLPLGKKAAKYAEDEEETAAEEDEEEEVAASKKKGKKGGKTIAPPVPAQPSMALRWLGGMFLGAFFLIGGVGAAWYFAPDTVKELTEKSPNLTPVPPPKAPEKSNVEKARLAMEQGNYPDAVALLKDASLPAELGTRGEAKWLGYYKQQAEQKAPLDRNAPAVKDALADLENAKKADAKNAGLLINQIDNSLKEQELNDALVKMKAIEDKTQKDLLDVKTAKEKADQLIDETKKALVEGKVVEKANDIDPALLAKKLKDLNGKEATLEEVNKLLKDAKIDGAGNEGVKEALKAKKENEDKVAAVNKVLEEEKVKGKDAEGVMEIAKLRTATTKDRDELAATIAAAFKELVDGKIVPMNDDPRKQIVEGVKIARQKAESPLSIPLTQLAMSLGNLGTGTSKVVEQGFDLAKVFSELGYFRAREPFIQTPEQKMDTYITLLQDRRQTDAKELTAMNKEADWVLSEPSKAGVEARGKARYVQGLVLRNEGKFAEAKTAFAEALKTIQPLAKTGPWSQRAKQSQQELSDASAYYLPRIEKFRKENNLKAALAEADMAIQALPLDARLFAERSLVRYDLVRGQGGKIAPEAQQAIRADAETVAKDAKLAAKSSYVLGLLEEELGHMAKAEELFRQAIKTNQGPADELDTYRIALASLLLKERPEAAPAVPDNNEKKQAEKAGAALPPREQVIVLHPWTLLVVQATLAAQPGVEELEDAETLKKLKEVAELAQQLIASANPKIKGQGHMLLGQTYAKLGRRTEGLKEMSKGLELLFPGLPTKDLTRMIEEHPAFQQPDVANNPSPVMAERHFGEGLYYYWAKNYPLAEVQFKQAVRFNHQYATYQYFLGLAQLHQKTKKKRDAAIYSFEQGARLEAKNNPPTRDINLSLERIQGELRQYLNSYRYKAYAVNAEAN